MKRIKPVTVFLSVFFALSCSSIHNFINKDITAGSTIAVIVAETKYSKVNSLYADDFTALLSEQTGLKVISQKQVSSVLGSYPERIQGPYKIIGTDEPKIDYNRHDIDTLAEIAKKLNAQYLYVFWIPVSVTAIIGGSELKQYRYISELIEFPSRRTVAQGNMLMCYVAEGSTKGPRTMEEMCRFYSEAAVKDIIQNTGAGR